MLPMRPGVRWEINDRDAKRALLPTRAKYEVSRVVSRSIEPGESWVELIDATMDATIAPPLLSAA